MARESAGPPALDRPILGRSEAFLEFQERLSRVAPVERPVLIVGERGTGKELAATRLHYMSQRWQGPLVALNCAALAPSLVEAELFGHEAGAFTGALRRRAGRFEAADGGTLFLDELGTMPPPVQEKLLRVVEYGVFERVGASASLAVDTRVAAATSADLPAMAARGEFKADLLDRLAFEVLRLPPLRERGEDVLLLAEHFAAGMALELGLDEAPAFGDLALAQLAGHAWPGNVRELKNVVERAVYRAAAEDRSMIPELDLDPFAEGSGTGAVVKARSASRKSEPEVNTSLLDEVFSGATSLPKALADLERRAVEEALARARHNQKAAARLLGLSYDQFRGRLRRLGEG